MVSVFVFCFLFFLVILFFSSRRFLFVVSETLHLPLGLQCQSMGSPPSYPLQVDGRFLFLCFFCFLCFLVIVSLVVSKCNFLSYIAN